jgi:polysaccharide biosynthesis transport protein
VELRDYLRVLQRRWLVILAVTVLVAAGGMYFVLKEPTVYTARAEVLVRENPYYFQAGDYQALFPDYFSRAARAVLIRNRPVLEYAVLHKLQKYYPRAQGDTKEARAALNDAIQQLRTGVQVAQEKDVEIIVVSYSDLDETRAVEIVNAVVEAFEIVSKKRQEEGVRSAVEYIRSTIQDRESTRRALERQLKELGPPPTETMLGNEEKALLEEIRFLQARAAEMRTQIEVLRTEVEMLSSFLERPEDIPVSSKSGASKTIQIRDQLQAKQTELRTLRRRFADHAEAVRTVLDEIQHLEVQYA